jgi:hypothetical protein
VEVLFVALMFAVVAAVAGLGGFAVVRLLRNPG